jgi:hypothetical protein
MTIQSLDSRFNIPNEKISHILKIKNTLPNERFTIEEVCKKNKLNCTEVLVELNNLIKK